MTKKAMSLGLMAVLVGAVSSSPAAAVLDPADLLVVDRLVGPAGEHCDSAIAGGDYETIFICGDEFFEFRFNAVDGGGANVGDGSRYTRTPRADLQEWKDMVPKRSTGPNAAGCVSCHATPVGTSAGPNSMNVIRDPGQTADPSQFIQRNTPHLMGSGALQRLAEEITDRLHEIRDNAIARAMRRGMEVERDLVAKGVEYGEVTAYPDGTYSVDAEGIDDDLIVRPFQWKGSDISLRAFTLDALNNEISMQPEEVIGSMDGDGDGVTNEATIADVTALVIYMAGQTRPHTELELDRVRRALLLEGPEGEAAIAELGLPVLTGADRRSIRRGKRLFMDIGCGDCHRPAMKLNDTVFHEPSRNPSYNTHATSAGLGPADEVSFDLAADMLDNHIEVGTYSENLANLELDGRGRGIVRLFGDLKRHDMGPGLAEAIDETGHGNSVWMTKELWGVGQTGQYLHDGRATTLPEAILLHGGDAEDQRDDFVDLTDAEQADLVRFLQNLVILKAPEEE